MLRRTTPTFGVASLWQVFSPLKIPCPGFDALPQRLLPLTSSSSSSLSSSSSSSSFSPQSSRGIAVGVDGNNLLHHLIRQVDLVKLILKSDSSELVSVVVSWARRSNARLNDGCSAMMMIDRRTTSLTQQEEEEQQQEEALRVLEEYEQQHEHEGQQSQSEKQTTKGEGKRGGGRRMKRKRSRGRRREKRFVFLFDGATPPAKEQTRLERQKQRNDVLVDAAILDRFGENELAASCLSVAPTLWAQTISDVSIGLKNAGFQVIHCPFEAEANLSYLCQQEQISAVLTSDSDSLVYRTPVVLRLQERGKFSIYDFGSAAAAAASSSYSSSVVPPFPSVNLFQHQQEHNKQQQLQKQQQEGTLLHFCGVSQELFCFASCAGGSDFNSLGCEAKSSLPGNPLQIFSRILTARLLKQHQQQQQRYNQEEEVFFMMNPQHRQQPMPRTVREACELLNLETEVALNIARACFCFLSHLIYSPVHQRIGPMNGSEENADLLRFIQELTFVSKKNNNSSHHHHSSSSLEADLLGKRRFANCSDEEWCEKSKGIEYRVEQQKHVLLDLVHASTSSLLKRSFLARATRHAQIQQRHQHLHLQQQQHQPTMMSMMNVNQNNLLNQQQQQSLTRCEICDLNFNSDDEKHAHVVGRRHRARAKIMEIARKI